MKINDAKRQSAESKTLEAGGGASTGSIIAAFLAIGKSVGDIADLYDKLA